MTLAARAGAPTGSGWDVRFADAVRVDSSHGVSTFRARDTETGRFVEIRLAARTTPAAYERLVREAEVQARVGSHPNVHTMFERLDAPGTVGLVFERTMGSFTDTFRVGAVAPQTVVSIGIKLAGALETLHRAGFVHTEVDPTTVLLSEWAEPVLARLGRAVPTRGAWGTVEVPTVHTAPEVLLGEEISPATDVYGLCAVLYLLASGRPAITASGGHGAAAVSASVLRSAVSPVLRADVPLDLSDLLVWGLAADAASRPPTAIWVGEELRRIEKSQRWDRTPLVVGDHVL